MTRRLVVRPQATIEIAEAAGWYDAQSDGLGRKFLNAMEATLARIERNPLGYQIRFGEARQANLRRFRYAVTFKVYDSEILIVACLHMHRDPAIWKSRL